MIRRRKHGKEAFAGQNDSATHRIKIGTKTGQGFPSPTNGFYVVRDNVIQGQGFELDMASMARLGYPDRTKVVDAIGQGRKAPVGSLPQQLEFVILSNAIRDDDGQWQFPGIIEEEYQAWHTKGIVDEEWRAAGQNQCNGLFCHSRDGLTASRRLPDGTRKEVVCVPYGAHGSAANEFCPYSQPKNSPCRAKTQLVVALAVRNSDGVLEPLAMSHAARFRFETTSENNAMRIADELARAADELNGYITGIEGTLTFNMSLKVTPDSKPGQTGLTPQVAFALNKWQISRRAQALTEGRRLEAGSAPALLEADQAPAREPLQLCFDDRSGPDDAEPIQDVEVGAADESSLLDDPTEIEPEKHELAPPASDSRAIGAKDATDGEIFDALKVFAADVAREEERGEAEVCASYLFFHYMKNGAEEEFRPTSVRFFLDGETPERDEFRRKKMREVAARLERQGDKRFSVYRDAETTTN